MALVDERGIGELAVVEEGEDSIVLDRNGNQVVTFHRLGGNYKDEPMWDAFLDGIVNRFPDISIFNETQARYHVCMGARWIESEGRYEGEETTPNLPSP